MPNETFGFNEPPFADLHDPRSIFSSRSHRRAVTCLRSAIGAREPFVLLTGLAGVGKTVAVEAALAEAAPHVRATIVASASMTREEFRERVLDGFAPASTDAAPAGGGLDARLRAIAADGRAAVLVVDQAQDLTAALLDDLRLYANLEADGHALLQIVLVGRPALEAVLAGPGGEALRQRIVAGCRLEPLSEPETADYVRHRVTAVGGDGQAWFAEEACATLHRLTHGIPGEIGRLATEALSLAGTAGEAQVTAGHVTFAVMMLGFRSAGSDMPAPTAFVLPGVELEVPTIEAEVPTVEPETRAAVVPDATPAVGTEWATAVNGTPATPEVAGPSEWTLTLQDLSIPQDITLPEDAAAFEPATAQEWTAVTPETGVVTDTPAAEAIEPPAPPVLHAPLEEPAIRIQPEPVAIPEIEPVPTAVEPPIVEPAAVEPAVIELAVIEPVAVEPAITEPVVVEPAAVVAAETAEATAEAPAPAAPAPRHARRRHQAAPAGKSPRIRRASGTPLLGAAALLVVAVVGLTIGHATRRRVQVPPNATVAVTTPAEPQAPSRPRPSRTAHTASATHRIAPVHPAGSPATPAPAAVSARGNAPKGRACAVEVATFLSESRARTERDRLAAALGQPCQVIPAGDDGYAVVVGPVADAKQAERLSTELSRGGLVGQARVVRWKAPGDSGR